MRASDIAGTLILLVFGLFWTCFVGTVDILLGTKIFHQIASTTFPSTMGQIDQSKLTRKPGSRGSVDYGVKIHYRYEVTGQPFEGQRFRYNEGFSSDSAWAMEAVAKYPVGAQAQVFYNPKSPQDSLLSHGLKGSDLIMVLFLTPFNMVMFGFWMGAMG